MPETITVRTRQTAAELKAELRKLPAYLTGRLYDADRLGSTFRAHFAYHLFDKISRAFYAKSTGGSDEFGDRWDPLKPETIVARESRNRPKTGRRGLLSEQQDRLWRRIFARNFAKLAFRVGEKEAKVRAAKMAWGAVKAAGAKTLKETLSGRRPPINWVSGRLKRSLMPGRRSAGSYQPPTEQRYEEYHGTLVLGTDVPYAPYIHKRRRLWPTPTNMLPWIQEASRRGIEAVARILGRK